MLIIDHGASIANEEQYDLTKSFGNHYSFYYLSFYRTKTTFPFLTMYIRFTFQ